MILRNAVARHVSCLLVCAFNAVVLSASDVEVEASILIEHSPSINGTVEGDLRFNRGGNFNLNSGAEVIGTLSVPGTPKIKLNGNGVIGEMQESDGAATPSGYKIHINGNSSVDTIITRSDPEPLSPAVSPIAPQGNRNVNINSPSDDPGDYASLRNLNINSGSVSIQVPPGAYGNFNANNGAEIVLGAQGSTEPLVYSFERLQLNGASKLILAGPVVVVLSNGFSTGSAIGSPENPGWLQMNLSRGGLNLNSNGRFYGVLKAPNGHVNINGNARFEGALEADRLNLNGGGVIVGNLSCSPATNSPPDASDGFLEVLEDDSVSFSLEGSDPDGDALDYTILQEPEHGVLTGSAPNLIYTPFADYHGGDEFSFSVNDGQEESAAALVAIEVVPVNDRPEAQSQSVVTLEDVSVEITLFGTDVESEDLLFAIVDEPTHGSLDLSGMPVVVYAPNQDFDEGDSFTFTVSDGESVSEVALVEISVTPVNDAPGAIPLEFDTLEDVPLDFTLLGDDTEEAALEFEVLSAPIHGTLSLKVPQSPVLNPDYEYTPDLDWSGRDFLTYRVFDGTDFSEEVSVLIDVTAVNDVPIVENAAFIVKEDTVLAGSVSGNDVDGDDLSFSVASSSVHGGLVLNPDGSFEYLPELNYSSSDFFTFVASDGELESLTGRIDIEVEPVNDAPVAFPDSVVVTEDVPLAILLSGADVEGQPLSFSVTNPPAQGSLSGAAPDLIYTPNENYSDSVGDSFSFLVNDGELDSEPSQVAISISPVNDLPIGDPRSFLVTEDHVLEGVLTASDVDGDSLTFLSNSQPSHGSLVLDGNGDFSYVPNLNYFGPDEFTFKVSDGDGVSDPVSVSINVVGENDLPVVEDVHLELFEDSFVSLTLEGVDVEGDALTFEIVTQPEFGAASSSVSGFLYTPDPNFFGDDFLEYRAFDGTGYSDIKKVSFVVLPVNDLPVAKALELTVEEDGEVDFTVLAGDLEDLDLNYELTGSPVHGMIVGNLPEAKYVPDADFFGTDLFTVQVSDLLGGSVSLEIPVLVRSVNDAPESVSFSMDVEGGESVEFALLGSDRDSPSVEYAIVAVPSNGRIEQVSAGHFSYTPDLGFEGSDVFQYLASDGELDSNIASVLITVLPGENEAPIVDAGPDQNIGFSIVLSENLILNAGAEDPLELGELPYWNEALGSSWSSRSGGGDYPEAKDGSLYFHAGSSDVAELYQDIELDEYETSIDAGIQIFEFSGYTRSKADVRLDQALFVVEFRGADKTSVLASYEISPDPQSDQWVLATESARAPIGARWIRIRLASTKAVGDSENSAYFDRLSLKAISYPVVALNGTVSDDGLPFGSTLAVNWSGNEDVESYHLIESSVSRTFVEFTAPGVYEFELYASDGELSDSDFVMVEVDEIGGNLPPLVDAGEDQTVYLPSAEATVGISTSDLTLPNGPLSVYWTVVEGTGDAIFDDPSTVPASIRFRSSGTYVLRLSADDGEFVGSDEITIYVDCPEEPLPLDFALAIDHSGSMGSGSGSKLDSALLASEEFIRNINPWTDQVSLFTFDSEEPEVALTNDQDLLLASVRGMSGGSSDFGRGIQFAQDHFDEVARLDSERIIVIVADGQTGSAPVIAAANAAKAKGSRIVCLGIGIGADEELLRLASSSPADYYFVETAEDVRLVYESLARTFCRHDGAIVSVFPEGNIDTAKVGIPVYLNAFAQFRGLTDEIATSIIWEFVSGPSEPSLYDDGTGSAEAIFDEDGTYLFKVTASATDGQTIVSDEGLVVVRVGFECDVEGPSGMTAWFRCDGNPFEERSMTSASSEGDYAVGRVGFAFRNSSDGESWQWAEHDSIDPASHGSFSLEYWFNSDAYRSNAAYLGWDNGTKVFYNSYYDTIEFRFYAADNSYQKVSVSKPSLGEWHHLAMTYSSANSEARLYLDGILVDNQVFTGFVPETSGDFHLGTAPGSYPVDGALDEISMYSKILSFAEVVSIYDAGSAGKCPVDANASPLVDAGADFSSNFLDVSLSGSVSDDGLPEGLLESSWSVLAGPGDATFAAADSPVTSVSFSVPGIYLLELEARDGLNVTRDVVEVRVSLDCGYEPDSSLVAHWSGNATSLDSVSGRELELRNGAGFDEGKVSHGFVFDGIDDSAKTLNADSVDPAAHGSFSVEYWFNSDAYRSNAAYLGWGNGTKVFFNSYYNTIEFRFYAADNSYQKVSVSKPSLGEWHHLAMTYSSANSEVRLYLDGILVDNQVFTGFVPETSGDFHLGTAPGSYPVDGTLDEISMYSKILSFAEVVSIYDAGSAGKCPVDANASPLVDAGADFSSNFLDVSLSGSVSDDGLPEGLLESSWSVLAGPGDATFAAADSPVTSVSFSVPGIYLLELEARDGLNVTRDVVEVRVSLDCGYEPDSSLVAHWSGNATSLDSVSGRELELRNGAGFDEGKVSHGFVFDGIDDSAKTLNADSVDPAAHGSFSVEYWFNSDAYRSNAAYLGWGNGTKVFFNSYYNTIEFRFYAADNSYQKVSVSKPSLGEWHHLAMTYSSANSEARLYLDGILVDNQVFTGFVPETSGDFHLGTAPGSYPVDGTLDEISMYSKILSFAEVVSIYDAGSAGKCPVDANASPLVDAGADFSSNFLDVSLSGSVSDDGLPEGLLESSWSVLAGPGDATFAAADSPVTSVSFSVPGIYLLELEARDGLNVTRDVVEVRVSLDCGYEPDSSLVAHWSGNATSLDSVSGRELELRNGAGFDEGKVSHGFVFDGIDDSAKTFSADSVDPSAHGSFSVEYWFNSDAYRSNAAYLGWDNGTKVFYNSYYDTIEFRFYAADNSYQKVSVSKPSLGEWHHLAMTYSSEGFEACLYLDGVLVDNQVFTGFVPETSGDFHLGTAPGSYHVDGSLDEISMYSRALSLAEVTSIYSAGSVGKCPVVLNAPPSVSLSESHQIQISENLELHALIVDDGLPLDGPPLSVQWSVKSGPGNVVFEDSVSAQTSVSFDSLGDYVLEIAVSDSEYVTVETVQVSVLAHMNTAPRIELAGVDSVQIGSLFNLSAEVIDDGYPIGSDLAIEWRFLSGPEEVALDPPQEILGTLSGLLWNSSEISSGSVSTPGMYRFSVVVSDGIETTVENVSFEAFASPEIDLTSPVAAQIYDVAHDIVFQANAQAGGLPVSSVEFFAGGSSLGSVERIPGTLTHRLTVSADSLPLVSDEAEVYAVAIDAEGRSVTSETISIQVLDTAASLPVAAFADGQGDAVWESPAPLLGIASSDIIDQYEIFIRELGNDTWRSLAVSQSSVIDGELAILDPTLLLNGIYELRLETRDLLGRIAIDEISVVVDGGMKIGNLSLAFEDLSIPVSGIPMQVVRSYDSRDNSKGDFGLGWQFALSNMRIQKNRSVGLKWMATQEIVTVPFFGETIRYRLESSRNNLVLLRLPDDSVAVFKAVATPASKDHTPLRNPYIIYEPQGNTLGKLEIVGDNQVWVNSFNGETDLESEAFAFDVFDPKLFKYTTPEGQSFVIDEDRGLVSMADRNGNTLTIDENGVTHSSGASITFNRDGEGRITSIVDPENQSLNYVYDGEGRLSTFTNRANETYTYLYENPDFPNYLTNILDPDDRSVLASSFDSDGRLASQTDGNGESLDFIHDIENFKETVVDRLGVSTEHTYDIEGDVTLTEVFDIEGNLVSKTSYQYDARGNETKVTDALGNVIERNYDDSDNLLWEMQVVSVDGVPTVSTTTYTYDGANNPLTIVDALDNVTTFVYDGSGNLLSQTDALGNVTTFAYDFRGNLKSITDPLGARTEFITNLKGFQSFIAVFDPDGILVQHQTFDYDELGRQTLVEDYEIPANATKVSQAVLYRYSEYVYDGAGRQVATRIYDATGTLLTQSSSKYSSRGLLERQTDVLGRYTEFEYDDNGNRTSSSRFNAADELLSSESWAFDAEGRQISYTDTLGHVTEYDYDALGRQIATRFMGLLDSEGVDIDPSDTTETGTIYDEIGRVTATYDELDNVTLFEYDENCGCSGRRAKTIDALGKETSTAYDLNGNQVSVTDANGHTTAFEYDALNRPTKTVFHDGTSTETVYDVLGRRIATIDQNARRTDYRYDSLGRLIEVIQPAPEAGEPRPSTEYRYDSRGNQVGQIDALGRSTQYEYDDLGRRVKRILPEGQEETYRYDAAGKLIAKTDFNGYTTAFEYDDQDRLVEETADTLHPSLALTNAPARTIHSYDAAGNRLRSELRNGLDALIHESDYAYDSRNRLLSRATSEGTLAYTYDAAGNLQSTLSSTAGGVDNSYAYDALNRLESVDDQRQSLPLSLASYVYDAVGNLDTVQYGNGISHGYVYNSLNRLTSLSLKRSDDSTVASYGYTLGAAGNRQSVLESNGRQISYGYDDLYRLTSQQILGSSSGRNGTVNYGYDAVGNRLNRGSTGTIGSLPGMEDQAFSYDDNDRLDSDQYDANGNTIGSNDQRPGSLDTVTDVYDYRNRILRRSRSTGEVIALSYDADGNRVEKLLLDFAQAELSRTLYLVDLNNHTGYAQVVEKQVNSGGGFELEASYLYGHDLVSQTLHSTTQNPSPPTTSWYLYDGHGTVRGLADEDGLLTDTYEYDAFGVLLASTGTTENDYLYTGEQYDVDLGMYFLRARYLNASNGRFHNMDTYEGRNGEPLTLHKYLYAHANPVMGIDPSGRFTISETAVVGGIIGLLGSSVNVAFNYESLTGGQIVAELVSGTLIGAATGGAGKVSSTVIKGFVQRFVWMNPWIKNIAAGALGGAASSFMSTFMKELVDFAIYRKPIEINEFRNSAGRIAKATFIGFGTGAIFSHFEFLRRASSPPKTIPARPEDGLITWLDTRFLEDAATNGGLAGQLGSGTLKSLLKKVLDKTF